MLHPKFFKYAISLTLLIQQHAVSDTNPVINSSPPTFDSQSLPNKTSPAVKDAPPKWAPIEISSTKQPDISETLSDNIANQNRREFWEARLAELNANYQTLRQQAQADGIELANIAPLNNEEPKTNFQADLERMQAVINAMTPEERDVCTMVHRLSVGLMQSSAIPPPSLPPEPMYNHRYNNVSPYEYGGGRQINHGGGYYQPPPNNPNYNRYGGYYGRGDGYYSPDWQGGSGGGGSGWW